MEGRRRLGDRYDGRRIRSLDPFFKMVPYIMKNRTDAQNLFESKIDIENLEAYIREKRKVDIKNIGMLQILIAAMVRTMSQKPGLNRFVAGQRIYARNEILVSMTIKKGMKEDGGETTIKMKFSPNDTIFEVADKLKEEIDKNKNMEAQNNTDLITKVVMACPGFLVKFLVWLLMKLDDIGLLPKVINQASPMHTSVYVTDLGSLGIQPVYHHIYNFGTTSIFLAFGAKYTEKTFDKENNIVSKRYVNLKVTTDERTVDGYYYASAFKLFHRLLQKPERLELPPEQVIKDTY